MMILLNTQNISYPSQQGGGSVDLLAVLTRSETTFNETYCVFIGQGTPEYVMAYGDKVQFEYALQYFPNLKKEVYRA